MWQNFGPFLLTKFYVTQIFAKASWVVYRKIRQHFNNSVEGGWLSSLPYEAGLVGEAVKAWGQAVKAWGQAFKAWGQAVKAWGQAVKAWGQAVKAWGQAVKAWSEAACGGC